MGDYYLCAGCRRARAQNPDVGLCAGCFILEQHILSQQGRAEAFDRFREDAEQFIREAAAADTHSSDVDPGRVDPWEER